jgi:putative Mg2+ transporter-C (MgtC) family protein
MLSFSIILLRLTLALVLGGAIGLERELSAHSAGLRTNALVSLGSALFMLISQYGFINFLGLQHVQVDPSRVASYVVAGIGFLGGGAIIFHREQEQIKGLTTAAAIWSVAALGLACGAGLIVEALTTTVLALTVLIGLRWLERRLRLRTRPQPYQLSIRANAVTGQLLETIMAACSSAGITPQHLEVHAVHTGVQVEITCLFPPGTTFAQTITQIQGLPGVESVRANLEDVPQNREE